MDAEVVGSIIVQLLPLVLVVLAAWGISRLMRGRSRGKARRANVVGGDRKSNERKRRFWIVTIFASVAIGAIVAILLLPAQLLRYWAELTGDPTLDRGTLLGPAAQVVLLTLGGLVALVTLGLSYDRHGAELDKEANATERDFRARFTKISESLSSTDWTRRSNGLRELGILADDWHGFGRSDERKRCIDVLCEYLQSPWSPEEAGSERESHVREVGFSVIAEHLRLEDRDPKSWHALRLNLRRSVIHRADLSGIRLGRDTVIDLTGATVVGGYLRFSNTLLDGWGLRLYDLNLRRAKLVLSGTRVVGGSLAILNLSSERGEVDARGLRVRTNTRPSVQVSGSAATTKLDFSDMRLERGGVAFGRLHLVDSSLHLSSLRLSPGFNRSCELSIRAMELVNSVVFAAFETSRWSAHPEPFTSENVTVDIKRFDKTSGYAPPSKVKSERGRGPNWLRSSRELEVGDVVAVTGSALALHGLRVAEPELTTPKGSGPEERSGIEDIAALPSATTGSTQPITDLPESAAAAGVHTPPDGDRDRAGASLPAPERTD